MMRTWLWLSIVAALIGCGTPTPNDLVEIVVPGAERFAISTEDGLVALAHDDLGLDELPIRFYASGTPYYDDADVTQRTGEFGLLVPRTARLPLREFAVDGPREHETVYIQVLELDDPERRPHLVAASLYQDGRYGDLLQIDELGWTPTRLASQFAGAGVYAERDGRYVLVGIVNGMVCSNPDPGFLAPQELLPFAGLASIATVLPQSSDFFKRRIRAFRPDFEYGLEADGREPDRRVE